MTNSSKWQPQIVRVPGTDAEEISQIAGIDAGEFESGELRKVLRRGANDQKIAEAFDVLALRSGQRQAQEADEGDNGGRTLYDGFHGGFRLNSGAGLATKGRFRPEPPPQATQQQITLLKNMDARSG